MWALGAPAVQAQAPEVRVSARAQPSEAGLQEAVTYRLQVEGAQLSTIDTPQPPATTNLVLQQSTPSTQREVTVSPRGRMLRRITYRWSYRPMRVGPAQFKPTNVTVDGQTYATESVRVSVVPQNQRPSMPSTSPHGAQRPSSEGARAASSTLDASDLFIRANPSAQRVYQNEQLTVEYRLFFRPNMQLRHSRLASAWDANGFWREELDVASRPRPSTETVNGQTYQSIVLKRVALFPTRPGTLRVDPLQIETEAYATERRTAPAPRSGFRPVTFASDAVRVRAEPLPPGAPPSFRGAVGQFDLDVRVSADSVRVGEGVRVRVTVRGEGNFATMEPPAFAPPAAFGVYDPTEKTQVDRGGTVVRGTKTFEYVLVPRENGRFTLPPVTLATFDPRAERYETMQSEPRTLHVTGEAQAPAVSTTGEGLPVGDIAGLATEAAWERTDAPPIHRQPWAYAGVLAVVLLGAGGVAYRRTDRPLTDLLGALLVPAASGDSDAGPARREADAHLKAARRHLRDGETKPFYQSLERALRRFVSLRTGTSAVGLAPDAFDDLLAAYGVPRADRTDACDLLVACSDAQFAPDTPTYADATDALQDARRLLRRLDHALPNDVPA